MRVQSHIGNYQYNFDEFSKILDISVPLYLNIALYHTICDQRVDVQRLQYKFGTYFDR